MIGAFALQKGYAIAGVNGDGEIQFSPMVKIKRQLRKLYENKVH